MLKYLNKKTQFMSAAIMMGMMSSAHATDGFGQFTDNISDEVTPFTDIVGYISYLGGFALAALGIVGLKQHVENPGQNPMKNALAKLGFGGMLIALPPVVAAIQGSGAAGGGTVDAFSSFNTGGIRAGSAGGA